MKFINLPTVVVLCSVLVSTHEASAKISTKNAHYNLAIHYGEDTTGPILSQVTLDCHPTGGSHPHAKAACSALDEADGSFENLSNDGGICTFIYEPVTAIAESKGYGKKSSFVKTYSNRCVLASDTNHVFDF